MQMTGSSSQTAPRESRAGIVFFSPKVVRAHHILGLPHYSYKENYPQVPVMEIPATTGPYRVVFQCYPGEPNPGEPTNLVFYIKDSTSDKPYDRHVGIRVLQTFTFGNNHEIQVPADVQPFDGLHKLSATFPEDGEYVVELTMLVEGQTEVIPFPVIAGDPTATLSIVAAIGAGLLVFLVVVRAIKVKAKRRRRNEERIATEEVAASAT